MRIMILAEASAWN